MAGPITAEMQKASITFFIPNSSDLDSPGARRGSFRIALGFVLGKQFLLYFREVEGVWVLVAAFDRHRLALENELRAPGCRPHDIIVLFTRPHIDPRARVGHTCVVANDVP